jgi:ATP-dependent DNA helicase RecQ
MHAAAQSKRRSLLDAVAAAEGPGIIYAATRAATQQLAAELVERGVTAAAYHAGFPAGRRTQLLEAFLAGEVDVVVATIAFGMGIDKPDVRFVYHLDVSATLDAYYQEIGRAGRDGEPAEARLFYRPADLGLRRFQATLPVVESDLVRDLIATLRRRSGATPVDELSRTLDRSPGTVRAAVERAAELDALTVEPGMQVRALASDDDVSDIAIAASAAQEALRAVERSRVELVRGYAETAGCRRRYLLNAFGEEYEPPCDACDRCLADRAAVRREAKQLERSPFELNQAVRHPTFGPGTVARTEADRVVIRFESVGYKTLAVDEVIERHLLVAEG